MSPPSQPGRRSREALAQIVAGFLAFALFLAVALGTVGVFWWSGAFAVTVLLVTGRFGALAGVLTGGILAALAWLLTPLQSPPAEAPELVNIVVLGFLALLAGYGLHRAFLLEWRRGQNEARRTQLLTQAAMELQKLDNTDAIYRNVLRMLADILEFAHATVFVPRDGEMFLVASHRWTVSPGFNIPMESVIGEAARTKAPNYVPDVRKHPHYLPPPRALRTLSELAIPLLMEERVAAVLNIEHVEVDAFGPDEYRTLVAFGKMVEEALERASLQMQLVEMFDVIRNLAQSDEPEKLFRETVESAIRLIPGADTGSLVVFEDGMSKFVAVTGFDEKTLSSITGLGYETQLKWYGRSEEDFLAGVPRLLLGSALMEASLDGLETDEQRQMMLEEGRIGEMTANICVPVIHGGRHLGILNIDSFADANPFGPHALRLAETFAQQIAVIIRQALYREALEKAVVTDPLTGLGNREAFNRQLNVELARARRYDHRFNLVMIDLDGFKRVNDSFGHHTGDTTLQRVAQAMDRQRREGDTIYRWAGDEFALILPQIARDQAHLVAERYAAAVACVEVDGLGLSASFGIASYPEDGEEAETLLRKADDLMYQHKTA